MRGNQIDSGSDVIISLVTSWDCLTRCSLNNWSFAHSFTLTEIWTLGVFISRRPVKIQRWKLLHGVRVLVLFRCTSSSWHFYIPVPTFSHCFPILSKCHLWWHHCLWYFILVSSASCLDNVHCSAARSRNGSGPAAAQPHFIVGYSLSCGISRGKLA